MAGNGYLVGEGIYHIIKEATFKFLNVAALRTAKYNMPPLFPA